MPEDTAPEYAFPAPVLRDTGGMGYHYVPLPDDVGAALREAGVRRVTGTLNGTPFSRAVQGNAERGYRLTFGLAALRDAKLQVGDIGLLAFEPDPDPDHVELPAELVAALDDDAEAGALFYAMTPGRRRSLAYYVTSAKRTETRERRAYELAEKIRTRTLYGDGPG